MIRAAICDDEVQAVKMLREKIHTYSDDYETVEFFSGNSLRSEMLNGTAFDVVFLDVNLPDGNGIALARHIKAFAGNSLVVFVSSQDDAVYESFSAAPFRFLRKSRLDKELPDILRDIRMELSRKSKQSILLSYRQATISVDPYKVLYIESQQKMQIIHFQDRTIRVNYRLKELEPHNSFLVNYRFISSIKGSELFLDNGEVLPISKHRLAELKDAFLVLISE